MEFPYLFRKDKSYPIIPIKISSGSLTLKTEALVDSGANISVFSSDIADYLELVLTGGKQIYLQGVGGRIVGYIHKVKIDISGISFRCPIVFSAELITSFNIIGRDAFFDKFLITFDEARRKLILKPIKPKKVKKKRT
jgi:hypothetical protein